MPNSHLIVNVRSMLGALCLAIALGLFLPAASVEYFLGTGGNDANSGLSESVPLLSFYKVNTLVAPGDTITFLDGVHRESWRQLTVSGTAAQSIRIRAKNPRQATLAFVPENPSTVLLLARVNYVTIEGLVIDGGSTRPVGTGTGADHGIAAEYAHHITVRNCRVKDCWGGGISAIPYTWGGTAHVHGPADHILFEDNDVSGCGFWNTYQCSGISIYQARSAGLGDAPGGFNIIIRRNRIWGCANKITDWGSTNPADFNEFRVTDGNGIIIDDFRHSQNTTYQAYPHRTLVENNIVVGNGGRGVHVYQTDHVTVRNNTCWGNSLLLPGDFKGELTNAWGADNHWYNNLAVATSASIAARGQGLMFAGNNNVGCTFAKNLVIGPTVSREGADAFFTVAQITAANTTATDALMVAPGNDPLTANFRLQSSSPAVDAGDGTSGRFALTDYARATRPQRSGVDIGAYELAGGTAGTLALSSSAFSHPEGNAGTSTATITVTRTLGSTGAVGIAYATSNGTATAGSDYTATNGTLSWAAGDAASKTFTVTVAGDTAVEANETVVITLSTVTGGATAGTSSATLTIVNDDSSSSTGVPTTGAGSGGGGGGSGCGVGSGMGALALACCLGFIGGRRRPVTSLTARKRPQDR